MTQTWRQSINDLNQFINGHSEICITKEKMTVPENVRQQFYELFDQARESFIVTHYPDMIGKGKTLAGQYQLELEKAKTLINIENVTQEESLSWFVDNPVNGLQKPLREPLIKLLKGIKSEEEIEEEYTGILREVFDSYYFQAYENWLELSLINILESSQLFKVVVPTITGSFGHAQGYVMHLDLKHVIPPEETNKLSLKHRFDYCSFSVPDFIVYSKKLGKYVAIKARHHEANWIALDPSPSRDWIAIDKLASVLGNGYLLVYVADDPMDIALINDAKIFNRPDMIIEFREKPQWYNNEDIDLLKQRTSMLMPKSITAIVSLDSVPNEICKSFGNSISVHHVGVESNLLSPLVEYIDIQPC